MGLRPDAARWFELLTPRDQLTRALRRLARTGAVELQSYSQTTPREQLPDLRLGLGEFSEFQRRYGDWWPDPTPQPVDVAAEPAALLSTALQSVRDWARPAGPLIAEMQRGRRRIHDLETLRDMLSDGGPQLPNLRLLIAAGPNLDGRVYVLPAGAQLTDPPSAILLQTTETPSRRYLFALGERAQIAILETQLAAMRARPLELPVWLPAGRSEALSAVDERLSELREIDRGSAGRLDALHARHGLADALGRLHLLEWYVTHVPELPVTEHFAWITGWTSDRDPAVMEATLRRGSVNCLLRLTDPPPGVDCPTVLRNPVWARPFELFANLLGTPGAGEVDPSRLVAMIAPLMFGYMFADIGQGAVLLLVGLWLHKRLPALRLLIPGGVSAIAFGFVFGSIFANEQLITPLWLHPIEQPVTVLAASLVFGVIVISAGLMLDALQYHWSGETADFWGSRAGLAVTYAGMLLVPWQPSALWLIAIGGLWYIGGAGLSGQVRGASATGHAIQEYIELVLQLFTNTISFVRVGAFALAHAGLSAAVFGLADVTGTAVGWWIVVVLGNALIIALEGLVVSIQTTRLVLFEFFIRFLRTGGRRFRPLPAPEEAIYGPERSAT